jgi:predicted NBD/HSP70 family sugar kinase
MDKRIGDVRVRVRSADELTGGANPPAPPPDGDARSGRLRYAANMHPSGLRRVTERRVAHLLLRSTSLTRIEIARQTGLSVATIGKIIDTLVTDGVVEKTVSETPSPGPALGRPAEYFGLSRGRPRYVVIELGVKKTQAAALPIAGPVGDIQTAQFSTVSDPALLERRLKSSVELLDIDEPLAVLVSAPGVVDEQQKRILYSPNLHWSEGTQTLELIARAIPGRLVVVQEIKALALGYLARSDPHDSFLLVDTGDGVGGALVVDGRVRSGTLPLSAELGHTSIPRNRRTCGCGAVGCLETILGRRGLLYTAKRRTEAKVRKWSQLTEGLANQGVPQWLRDTLSSAAYVIAGAINIAGVSKVVLSGALLELGSNVLETMTEEINAHALWGRFGNIRVEAAPRQRLLGLTLAALDSVVLAPTPAELSFGQRPRGTDTT